MNTCEPTCSIQHPHTSTVLFQRLPDIFHGARQLRVGRQLQGAHLAPRILPAWRSSSPRWFHHGETSWKRWENQFHVHGKSHSISASKWLPSRQWQVRWQTKRHHGTRGVCEDAQVAVVAVCFAARVTEALGRTFRGTFPIHIICRNSVYIRIYIYTWYDIIYNMIKNKKYTIICYNIL